MKLDQEFLELIEDKGTLTQSQFNILEINENEKNSWKSIALQKDVTKNNKNLLMLLKGVEDIDISNKIVLNYHMVLDYNNINAKAYKPENNQNKSEEFLHIYCDGACSKNPGPAGSGLAIFSSNNKTILIYGNYLENGTNNIAELNALYQALIIAKQSNLKNKIEIFTDSKYSIDCISTWAYSWKKNSWSKKGGEIKNLELIIKTHNLYEELKNNIILNHVKGHSGVIGNELADRMAIHTINEKNRDFCIYEYINLEDILKIKQI
jgi:ribonuclease HI